MTKASAQNRQGVISKSILIGCGVEVVFASCFAFGGFGPCGPSNILGFIGILAHLFPGLFITGGLYSIFKFTDMSAEVTIVMV